MDGSPRTAQKYEITIRAFGRFLGRMPEVRDLEDDTISDFLCWYSTGRMPDTVWTARKHLVALGNFAHRRGIIPIAPDVQRVRLYERLPQPYTIDEISRLVQASRHMQGNFSGVPGALFFPALFLVAYDTGGRSDAIWSLCWSDYDERSCSMRFRAERQKHRRDQILRISQQTADALEAIRSPVREAIFALGRSSQMRFYYVKKCLKAAGLPRGRNDQLKRIRKTTLTACYELNVDATAQAGHRSDATTRKHYINPLNRVQAADVLPRPLIGDDAQLRLF